MGDRRAEGQKGEGRGKCELKYRMQICSAEEGKKEVGGAERGGRVGGGWRLGAAVRYANERE